MPSLSVTRFAASGGPRTRCRLLQSVRVLEILSSRLRVRPVEFDPPAVQRPRVVERVRQRGAHVEQVHAVEVVQIG